MPTSTRRTWLQTSGAAAAATLSTPAKAENQTVFHVFAFHWKPESTDAQKQRAAKDIAAFQGVIPGLLQTPVGPNLSSKGKGYTFGGVMQFTNQAALDTYVAHPKHQALLKWLVPLIDAIELDLHA